jgi:hypothetical protein
MSNMRTPKKPIMMARYKNLSGDSKVAKYEIEKDAMRIRFTDCSVYIYTNQSAGPENIKQMKTLAIAGKGLGTFISANLKDRFERKIR